MHKALLKWLIFIVIVINLMIIAVVLIQPPDLTRALPTPNGYDDFLRAADMVVNSPENLDQITRKQLSDAVAANAAALKTLRLGLSRDCVTHVSKSMDEQAKRMAVYTSLKSLARALLAEGKLAQLEGRANDAARAHIDSIRFGQEIVRGGLLIDGLVGIAFEKMGATTLAPMVETLPPAACRTFDSELSQMIAKRERAEDIQAQERAWSRRVGGWRGHVLRVIWLFKGDPIKPAVQKYMAQDQAVRTQLDQLVASLETRARAQ